MFSRYYELVKRGGRQADALPVLASQIYLDSVQSLYFLDLIEAEIGSQSTELVLELEWGELTDQISATVGDVKVLLWGEEDRAQDILEVGLQESASRDGLLEHEHIEMGRRVGEAAQEGEEEKSPRRRGDLYSSSRSVVP